MSINKSQYLDELTKNQKIRSIKINKNLDGSTPPSVFIGHWNYPKVYAGPMITPDKGDTSLLDSPETWIQNGKTGKDIFNFRMNLIRGKQLIGIKDLENPYIEKLQSISLSKYSTDSEATFKKHPTGGGYQGESEPYGPSALIKKFDIDEVRWDKKLEKSYYDTDLKATDAVMAMYNHNVPFSKLQKAFSVGAFGEKQNRKLVPTRWSITACDTAISNGLLKEVKYNPTIDSYEVYNYSSLGNNFIIILIPEEWEFEMIETYLKVLNNEKITFIDHEYNKGKTSYSPLQGAYYAGKLAVLEHLRKVHRQSGVIIIREIYENFEPLGVFNVRENIRIAMSQNPMSFETLKESLNFANNKLKSSTDYYVENSHLLKELFISKQTTLDAFF